MTCTGNSADHGRSGPARAGMRGYAHGLIDDDHVIVGIENDEPIDIFSFDA